ncbi:DUF1887 domain-containing protein [Caldanaerobacter sp.]|uniref:DUF1887 domain-containing protein n=1 Tax=Caldanaerobacter sp. TaxID=2930036 RepID=UPI003C7080F7
MQAIISLIGEQPIPNLLPIRYFSLNYTIYPVFVHTSRTEDIGKRLQGIFKGELRKVEPYNLVAIENDLEELVNKLGELGYKITLNITGGTKPMSLAAFRIAERYKLPFFYLQSEGKKNILYEYWFEENSLKSSSKEIGQLLNIDLYLQAHQGPYEEASGFRNDFEKIVFNVLEKEVDEIKKGIRFSAHPSVEIDLVLRIGNNVGIAEVKSGGEAAKKRPLEQLITAGEARFLGTFTSKFLIIDREYGENNRLLAEAHRVKVIELPSVQEGALSPEDRKKLTEVVKEELGN